MLELSNPDRRGDTGEQHQRSADDEGRGPRRKHERKRQNARGRQHERRTGRGLGHDGEPEPVEPELVVASFALPDADFF